MNVLTTAALDPAGSTAALDRLGDEIAELSVHLEAATARLLDLIREFDIRAGWNNGFRSCAHWLSWRVGLDLGAAREKVRVARALGTLPRLARALGRGELSYAKVRALTRVATPATEERLMEVGRAGTAEHVERIVRGWRRVDRNAEAREAAQRHRCRALHVYRDHDGMVAVRGRLEPEVGELLIQALTAARETLYQRTYRTFADADVGEVSAETPVVEQQQADALALLAETALHRGIDPGAPGERYQVVVHVEGYQVDRDACGELRFRRPDGRLVPEVPQQPKVPADPVTVLRAQNEAEGLVLHARTAMPLWLGGGLNVSYAIDVLHPLATRESEPS